MIAAIPALFGQPYQPMLPSVVSTVLHSNATSLGLLESGAVGQSFGVSTALLIGGVICLITSVVGSRAKRAKLDELV